MSKMQDDDETDDDVSNTSHQQTPPANTTDPSSSDLPRLHSFVQVSPGKSDWNESLDIEQGENWLRLVDRKSAPGYAILDRSQDTTTGNDDAPYPSILSLEELSSIDKVFSEGCFLCVDVDGPYLAIKDTRSLEVSVPASQQETQTERSTNDGGTEVKYEYELRIARKGQSTLVASSLEQLTRRQLRLLHHGDRLCVLSSAASGGGGFAVTLVLEYRHEVAIRTPVGEAHHQASQQTMDASVLDDELVEAPGSSETMALTQPAPPSDDKIAAIPQMSTQPESEDGDDNNDDNYDDDDLTVDPDEGSRSSPEGGNAACDTPTKATRSEVCSPGDQSATLHGETQGPASMDQNAVSNVVPMAVIDENETLSLGGAGTGAGAEEASDGEVKEESSKAETAVMATPQKDGKKSSHTESNMFVSPNLMASPCSSEGSSQHEIARTQDDTVRKEGADTVPGSSNAFGEVKRTESGEMRRSDIGKTNGKIALLSPIAHESKVEDKTSEEDVVGAPRVEEAVQEITATGDVKISKDMPSDPSDDGEGLQQTEIDKPRSIVVGEADGTAVLGSGKAGDSKAEDKAIGLEVLEKPHNDESTGNSTSAGNASASNGMIDDPSVVDGVKAGDKAIGSEVLEKPHSAESTGESASPGDASASNGMIDDPSVVDGAKGGIASCDIANDVDGIDNSSSSARTSSLHVPEGVEQSGSGEATSRPNGVALDHVSPHSVAEVTTLDVDRDVPPPVAEVAEEDLDRDVPPPVPEAAQEDVGRDVSSNNAGGTTTTRSTRGRRLSYTGKEVNAKLVPGKQSEDNKAAPSINWDTLGHVDDHPVGDTLQQNIDRSVVSAGTAATRAMRKRGRSSPTEEGARGSASTDQSVQATGRATRKRGRGVSSEEVDSKREPAEQNGDNEATAGANVDEFDFPSASPGGERMKQDIDRGSSSAKAEDMTTTTKLKRKRGRCSPEGELNTKPVPDPVAIPSARPRSARKQPRQTSTPTVTDDAVAGGVPIRVLATRIELKQKEKNMIKRLGGVLLEDIKDAHTATHVISTDGTESIRRTPKLMIGICRTRNIVSKLWLLNSSKQGSALPCDEFLVLNDTEAEAKYDFSMRDTLERVSSNIEEGTSLLGGWWIYVCKGVAGNKAPSEDELKLIVEAAGGTWLSSLNSSGMKDVDVSRLLVVTGDPETKKQLSPKPVASALRDGAVKQTTSWLFHAVMAQHLDLPTTS